MNLPAAILFDLDGVLLDTEPLYGLAWRRAAQHFGGALSDEQLWQLRGRRRADSASLVASWLGDHTIEDGLSSMQQSLIQQLLPGAQPMPGARELLQRCAAHQIPTALVTSSVREAALRKTSHHPWLDRIDARVYGDDPDVKRGKPAADPFVVAARRLGMAPQDCWAIEDSPSGAQSASAASCRVFVLLAGASDPSDPRLLFPTTAEFLGSLDELLMPT